MTERLLAVGADGAHGGWLTVACYGESDEAPANDRRTAVALCRTLEEVVAVRAGTDAPVAVDMPMGLLDTVEFRVCDVEARKLLLHRRNTVFAPPSRPLLATATYAEAAALIAEQQKTAPAAKGISPYSYGLVPKVREVDDWLRTHPGAQPWLFECHPELSFRAMAGHVLDDKKTAQGQAERLRLVGREFPDVLDAIAATPLKAKDATLVDVLDAYAACDSALHVAAGDYEEIGGEVDAKGLIMRVVF